MYVCHSCGAELEPDDEVVVVAEQLDVTSFGDTTRQHLDGLNQLYHEGCWTGNVPGTLRLVGRGKLSVVASRP
jgi:hypothetical protein